MKKTIILLIIVFILTSYICKVYAENLEKAITLYQKGEYRKCVKYLENYIKTHPDPKAYYLLGYAYYKIKRYSDSINYFREAYFIDPEFSPSKINFKK